MRSTPANLAASAMFLVLLLALPLVLTNDYYVSVLIICSINAIIVVGLNLLLGYAGQISLGHAAFYGLAAYGTAILSGSYGWPMELSCLAAIVIVGIIALVIGIPTLKLSGHYLAMATLGFGIIVYIVFNEWASLTGGPSGFAMISMIPRLKLFGYTFATDIAYYRLVAVVLAVAVLASLNIIDSRYGRALRAIHTSEKAAQAMGVNIAAFKLFIFVLSAVYAGVAGVLYSHYLTFVAPSSFGFMFSVALITMVVLGGMANTWGSVAGAFFLTTLPQLLTEFEKYEVLVFGCILILGMLFLPQGIAGGLSFLGRTVAARLSGSRTGGGGES